MKKKLKICVFSLILIVIFLIPLVSVTPINVKNNNRQNSLNSENQLETPKPSDDTSEPVITNVQLSDDTLEGSLGVVATNVEGQVQSEMVLGQSIVISWTTISINFSCGVVEGYVSTLQVSINGSWSELASFSGLGTKTYTYKTSNYGDHQFKVSERSTSIFIPGMGLFPFEIFIAEETSNVVSIMSVFDLDTAPPTISITTLGSNDLVSGVQTITAVANDDVGVASIELYIDGAFVESHATDAPGQLVASLSYQWDTSIGGEGSHEIKTIANDYRGLSSETTVKVTVDNIAEKIAVFLWASDCMKVAGMDVAGERSVILGYIGVLSRAGYTKFFMFEDSSDFLSDLSMVRAYEGASDTIFFYLWGHGNSDGVSHSTTYLRPGGNPAYSWLFRNQLDRFDSPRKGIFVESCYSGGWVEDFRSGNYLAISSTDLWRPSWAMYPIGGLFSDSFFSYVSLGFSAPQAVALTHWWIVFWQLPQMTLHDSYDFFALYNR
ncbi:MAG: Ig-like domain-containing protein [Promethearchaeota archaeon]